MLMRVLLIALAVLVVAPIYAQVAAPTLTDVEKLQLTVALQRFENAQLRLKLAQDVAQRAEKDAQGLIHSLEKPGYTIDIQRMVYVVKAPAAPAGETPQ